MDIVVEGIGKKTYKPDLVKISLDFYTRTDSYDKALEEGTRNVEIFISDILEKMQYSKEDMKTKSFRVYEEKKYDYDKKEDISLGYAYTQQAFLEFDYSMSKVAEFMDLVSKLSNPPKYYLSFSVKNIKECKKEAMKEAFKMAKEKAENIANVSGKVLKDCVKTDFRPFSERVISNSSLNSLDMMQEERGALRMEKMSRSVQDTIQTIFTPEDVEISETLYCLWIAE